MWRELRGPNGAEAEAALSGGECHVPQKTFAQAAWQIVAADVSMSLDNVLAVAGAARDHPAALVFGLGLSIVLMGLAASLIARLLNKHRWIAYVGLAIILYVAADMIWRGFWEIQPLLAHALGS
jgi:YjbE family integral membrane protein